MGKGTGSSLNKHIKKKLLLLVSCLRNAIKRNADNKQCKTDKYVFLWVESKLSAVHGWKHANRDFL